MLNVPWSRRNADGAPQSLAWGHPLATGCKVFYVGTQGGGRIINNLADPRDLGRYTLSGATSGWNVNAPAFRSNNDYILNSVTLNIPRVTIVIEFTQRVAVGVGTQIAGFSTGGANDKHCFLDASKLPRFSIYDGATRTTAAGSTTVSDGQRVVFVGTCDGTTVRCFLNGVVQGTVAGGNSYAAYGGPNVYVGGAVGGGVQNQMDLHMFGVWARPFTTDEVVQISQNPLAPVWQPGRRVYFDVGAAAFDASLFPRTDFDDLVRRRDTMIPSGRVA